MTTDNIDEDPIYIENDTDLDKIEDKLRTDALYRSALVCTIIL